MRAQTRTKIFLGYTSNLISSGLRETLNYLVKNKSVTSTPYPLFFCLVDGVAW